MILCLMISGNVSFRHCRPGRRAAILHCCPGPLGIFAEAALTPQIGNVLPDGCGAAADRVIPDGVLPRRQVPVGAHR